MEAHSRNISIVPFKEDYREQVLDLWEHAFGKPRSFLEKDLDRAGEIADDLLALAVEDGLVVGTMIAASDGYRGWIYYLAVRPSHRRQGIARMLMDAGNERLRNLGCDWVNLQVRQRNREVVGFYARQGFRLQNTITLTKKLDNPS